MTKFLIDLNCVPYIHALKNRWALNPWAQKYSNIPKKKPR